MSGHPGNPHKGAADGRIDFVRQSQKLLLRTGINQTAAKIDIGLVAAVNTLHSLLNTNILGGKFSVRMFFYISSRRRPTVFIWEKYQKV